MSFQDDPAGLGVSKNYGTRTAGNNAGTVGGVDGISTAEFQIKAGESVAQAMSQAVRIPPYAIIREVYVKVEEAFAASSTVDVQLGGTTVLTAVSALSALGADAPALSATAGDLETGAAAEDLKIVVDANGLASGAGFASIAVRYTSF